MQGKEMLGETEIKQMNREEEKKLDEPRKEVHNKEETR